MTTRITMLTATHATVHITRHRFLRWLGWSDEDFEVFGDELGQWWRVVNGREVSVSADLERRLEAAWHAYVNRLTKDARVAAVRGERT